MKSRREELALVLAELDSPDSPRGPAVAHVIAVAMQEYSSPFLGREHSQEEFLIPLLIKLGMAVRLTEDEAEPESGRMTREDYMAIDDEDAESMFGRDVMAAFDLWNERGVIAEELRPTDPVWWDHIIPDAIMFGYSSVELPVS